MGSAQRAGDKQWHVVGRYSSSMNANPGRWCGAADLGYTHVGTGGWDDGLADDQMAVRARACHYALLGHPLYRVRYWGR